MPVTQWPTDSVPTINGDAWRVRVGDRLWSREELERLGHDQVVATLDCTGGWYAHQRGGVRLDRLLTASGATVGGSVVVRSVTGYSRRFPRRDEAGVLRLAGSILLEVHDEWQVSERRYLSEASMAKLADTDNHGSNDKEVGTTTKELLVS